MKRSIVMLGAVGALIVSGCMAAGPDQDFGSEELRGRKACTHTGMCEEGERCSVEDGDCFSNCPPGQICPAVCWGFCTPPETDRFCYSSANCEEGEYCSVEDGECLSNCPPGQICPAVCQGRCLPGDAGVTPLPKPQPPEDGELRRKRCYSSANCAEGEYCTTEDGDCHSPCPPGMICPAVCTGFCAPRGNLGQVCGDTVCAKGMVCCNASCGICTPPGWACTQQACI